MNARRVHAVLAAGVQSPDLIERWQRDPQQLRAHGIDQDTLDLSALWKFAGLTTKVRHNGLRQRFPLTFRLLHVAGMEIEVFASYASFRSSRGHRYAPTTEQRAADLIHFLQDWLDLGRRDHSLLWDVIRHEQALSWLAGVLPSTAVEGAGASPLARAPSSSSVPVVNGRIVLHEMQCDPREVAPMLFDREPRLHRLELSTRHRCYWRAGSPPEIRVLELDEFGYYALGFSDGVRSVAELSDELGGGPPTPVFMSLLSELAAVGVLGFKPGPGRGPA
ncbi:MAG: RiPP maturation protein ApyI [Actinomycetota bacterium]